MTDEELDELRSRMTEVDHVLSRLLLTKVSEKLSEGLLTPEEASKYQSMILFMCDKKKEVYEHNPRNS